MDFISSFSFPNEPLIYSDQLNISWPFLSPLLGECNSKATANPPKSDEKKWSRIVQLIRVSFGKEILPINSIL